jgi:magnesium transporter
VTTALLFEQDAVDEVNDWAERLSKLGRSSILWIDLESPDEEAIRRLVTELELSEESGRRLADPSSGPGLGDYGSYVHVTAYALSGERDRSLTRVVCLVSERWVVTVRDAPIEILETFRERATGSGDTGRLDGLEFLADLFEWVLHSYLEGFEAIERELEDVDAGAMRGEISGSEPVLGRLVELRREIGNLRRALVSHRETVLALTRPELGAMTSSHAADRFALMRDRLEEAVQAARDSRESVVGSFDLLIASTGQRTNEIMKVFTLASVLLLPGALIAGLMGMNFKLGIFDNGAYFWVVIGVILGLAALTLGTARAKDWI